MGISISAHAIIIRNDNVLLIKRQDTGFWATPGGRIEENETIEQTVIREIKEECGIEIKVDGICGIFSNPLWNEGIHTIVFRARYDGELLTMKTPEASAIAFFEMHRLPEDILYWHRDYINSALTEITISNRIFKVRAPQQILERQVDYGGISETERQRLAKEYIAK